MRHTPSSPARFAPPAEPRTPKAAHTRQRLLEVAAGLFIERGFAAVSMTDVGAAAGMTKGALYGHFRSKGRLLVEVIRYELAQRDARVGERDPVELFVDPGARRLRLLEVDAAAAARHDGDVAAGLQELYAERHRLIRAAVGETADPDATAYLIAVLAGGIGMKEAVGAPEPGDDRTVAVIRAALAALADEDKE